MSTDVTLLTTPTVPLHHSVPERGYSYHEESDLTYDQDGIKHSFDDSVPHPTSEAIADELVSFLATEMTPTSVVVHLLCTSECCALLSAQ